MIHIEVTGPTAGNGWWKELAGLDSQRRDKVAVAEQTYRAAVAKYEAEVEEYREYAGMEKHAASDSTAADRINLRIISSVINYCFGRPDW